ncbi:MAG TPA: TRAFs-binding domain-containing protein [Verrucomicrobiae bacterium]|nr:TRAFs-binding domain-containing protein [Verrucomicrobiae bacterium]
MKPLVFIAMPFGKKMDQLRRYTVDFDDIYERGIKPAVLRFDVECIRADEERSGGVIHLPMFERLLLAEIAIVDVTLPNPNVYYELGIRHAARPRATIIIGHSEGTLPFDIAMIRALPYTLTDGRLESSDCEAFVDALASRIEHTLAEYHLKDSPLFQMIPELQAQSLPHEITDSFRDRARELDAIRERLDAARHKPKEERKQALAVVGEIERELGAISSADTELFFEVFLAYRDLEAFDEMIALAERAPEALRASVPMLREQHAFALNRRNRGDDRVRAVAMLEQLIEENGHSPETSSLLARIYKDQYFEAVTAGERLKAGGFLTRAIDLYRHGFNADPRDYYPGVNLCTLLALKGTPEAGEELKRTVPAVAFAVGRLGGANSPDYWQVATVLELALLGSDADTAVRTLEIIATLNVAPWHFKSTAKNLKLLSNTAEGVLDKTLLKDATAELEKLGDT